jgi:hypothetical protein
MISCFSCSICQLVQAAVYSGRHLAEFRQLIKNRRAVEEYFEHGDLASDWQNIKDQYRKEMKILANSSTSDQSSLPQEDATAATAKDQLDDDNHMELLETVSKALEKTKSSNPANHEEEQILKEKLKFFRDKARRYVNTHIKLFVESETSSGLFDELKQTLAFEMKGKRDDEGNVSESIAIVFDGKMQSEAATQPHLRQPPMREGRLPRLIQSILSLRAKKCSDETLVSLDPCDIFILSDAGKLGKAVIQK